MGLHLSAAAPPPELLEQVSSFLLTASQRIFTFLTLLISSCLILWSLSWYPCLCYQILLWCSIFLFMFPTSYVIKQNNLIQDRKYYQEDERLLQLVSQFIVDEYEFVFTTNQYKWGRKSFSPSTSQKGWMVFASFFFSEDTPFTDVGILSIKLRLSRKLKRTLVFCWLAADSGSCS